MIQATLSDLLDFMRKNKYEADIQQETQQIFTVLKISKREYPLFLRFFEKSQLLQLLVFIPISLAQGTTNDLARLLHLLNKEVDMPGFGMDEMAGVIFYRLMLPIRQKKIEEDLLLTCLSASQSICQLFVPPIEAVAGGQATLDQILEQIRQAEQQQNK